MGRATFRALPRPHVQQQFVFDEPATGAAFAGGKEAVDFDIRSSRLVCLVRKLASKFPPACIRNVLGQFGIFDHVLHGKVFSTDHLVLVY